MKNKKAFLIILAVFVLLIAGASVLYNRLGAEAAPDQLATAPAAPTAAPTEAPAPAETAAPAEEAAPEETAPAETAPPEPQTVQAPDFTVYDIDGNEVHLSDYFGKPIVLNFWASWCGPCKSEMPDFNAKYLELDGAVHFLMINMTDGSRETVETASQFVADQGYSFPVFYDTDSTAAYVYQAFSLPTTYFIDADGNAIAQATGAINAETLQRGIDMIYNP